MQCEIKKVFLYNGLISVRKHYTELHAGNILFNRNIRLKREQRS